jgi:hypothetical protein
VTEQERIARLAKWMGWELLGMHWVRTQPCPDGESLLIVASRNWNPLTSLDHARMLEDEVERRGLQTEYGNKLVYCICEANHSGASSFDLAHATPEQRCQAVERLMEVEG